MLAKLLVEKIYTDQFKLSLLKTIGDIEIYVVNGDEVKLVEPDFNNFGQHIDFSLIPDNELWIDVDDVDEARYYISNMLKHRQLMLNGMSYADAEELADKYEQRERLRSSDRVRHISKDVNWDTKVVIKSLGKDEHGVPIDLVRGDDVRVVYPEFTEGGNSAVYDFIDGGTVGKIWIDNKVKTNRDKVIKHESDELHSMINDGLSYDEAHELALSKEWKARVEEE
jgi:hypothetical protein